MIRRLGDLDASFTHPPYLSASAFDYGGSVGAQEIVMLDVNFTHCASTPKDFGLKNGNEMDTSDSSEKHCADQKHSEMGQVSS
jgi:hypothetical protein